MNNNSSSNTPASVVIAFDRGAKVSVVGASGQTIPLLGEADVSAFARERSRRKVTYDAFFAEADRRLGEPLRADFKVRAGKELEAGILKAVWRAVKAAADRDLAALLAAEARARFEAEGAQELSGQASVALRVSAGYAALAASAVAWAIEVAEAVRPDRREASTESVVS